MRSNGQLRIQAKAAHALADWKAFFAEHVATHAKQLAREGDSNGLITVDHYRRAASLALRLLEARLHEEVANDGRQEAA
jgi:hypothetical protein